MLSSEVILIEKIFSVLSFILIGVNIVFPPLIDTLIRQTKSQETSTMTASGNTGTLTTSNSTQNHVGSQIGQDEVPSMKVGGSGQSGTGGQNEETCKSEGTQAGGTLQQQQLQQQQLQLQQQNSSASTKSTSTRTKDYNDEMVNNIPWWEPITFSH